MSYDYGGELLYVFIVMCEVSFFDVVVVWSLCWFGAYMGERMKGCTWCCLYGEGVLMVVCGG